MLQYYTHTKKRIFFISHTARTYGPRFAHTLPTLYILLSSFRPSLFIPSPLPFIPPPPSSPFFLSSPPLFLLPPPSLPSPQDDDYAISRKVKKVLSQGLVPVLCVGESRYVRTYVQY